VETSQQSALATVRGTRRELDALEDSLRALAGQTGQRAAQRSGMQVWLRCGPEELEVLTGFLLGLHLENAGPLKESIINLHVAQKRLADIAQALSLRHYQGEAVWAAVTAPWGRGVISCPTGSGKTRIAHAIAEVAGGRWLYLAPSMTLALQTADAGAPSNLTCSSFSCAGKDGLESCDGLIVDELHRVGACTYSRTIIRSRARFRIGLSATPFMRRDPRNVLAMGLLGPEVYSISLRELQAQGFLPSGIVRNVPL
jgi:superfamily II DNA or RNA helicase